MIKSKKFIDTPSVNSKLLTPVFSGSGNAVFAFCALVFSGLALVYLIPATTPEQAIGLHFLTIHNGLEGLSILICFMIFAISWTSNATAASNSTDMSTETLTKIAKLRPTSIVYLGIISLCVGLLDLGHTMSQQGMPEFFSKNSENKTFIFWFGARSASTLALLLISSFPISKSSSRLHFILTVAFSGWTALVFWFAIFRDHFFLLTFLPKDEFTGLKVAIEFLMITGFTWSALLFALRAEIERDATYLYLCYAGILFMTGEVFSSLFNSPSYTATLVTHACKLLGFGLIYRAIFTECVVKPYQLMQRIAHELQIASETKSFFLANVSHEIRTPLGVIFGFSELLLGGKNIIGEERDWLLTLRKNAEQLKFLIDDLLDLTKIETGQIAIHKERIYLQDILDDVASTMALPAATKFIKLIFNCHETVPHTIETDPIRFRQILVNLIGNALKFTEKGTVEVSLDATRKEWSGEHLLKVSVKDSGIGITEEQHSRLFRPFSQGDLTMSRRYGGTGLGLALSRKLSLALDGDLWLKESQIGEGSTFCFTVATGESAPQSMQAKDSATTTQPIRSEATKYRLHGISILVVDDSQDNRFIVERYLEASGATVRTAANGASGVELARSIQFDLIFMDIQMPEMDGYQATQLIRKAGIHTPIAALTAHALQVEQNRALASGFNAYLTKPITKKSLIETALQLQNLASRQSRPESNQGGNKSQLPSHLM
jgi:signal transduction histidine kinase/CheY-like chemotaxis protein